VTEYVTPNPTLPLTHQSKTPPSSFLFFSFPFLCQNEEDRDGNDQQTHLTYLSYLVRSDQIRSDQIRSNPPSFKLVYIHTYIPTTYHHITISPPRHYKTHCKTHIGHNYLSHLNFLTSLDDSFRSERMALSCASLWCVRACAPTVFPALFHRGVRVIGQRRLSADYLRYTVRSHPVDQIRSGMDSGLYCGYLSCIPFVTSCFSILLCTLT